MTNPPAKYVYFVMDGRAAYDTDEAAVMECIGERNEKPSMKKLRKSWGGMDCCLCRAPITGPNTCGVIEFVENIP